MSVKRHRAQRYERYDFQDSPWVQDLTQRELADLLGTTKDRLERLIGDKDRYVLRRVEEIGGKNRNLAVPIGKLRGVHERLKFHLNKIKQPEYLYSPRKGRAQRDNAALHRAQAQFLGLDIRQFYPSTTAEHIFRWAHHVAGLRADVAGMLMHLVAIDGKMPFGSPVSPVLTTLVHREMFDEIYALLKAQNLRMSLWVDDLTISGSFVRGDIIEQIRAVIRRSGFQTHKIKFRSAGRPVIVTGVPIERQRIVAPQGLQKRVQDGYAALRQELTDTERRHTIDQLLSALGSYRYHVGAATPQGRQAANRMDALRTRRSKLKPMYITAPSSSASFSDLARRKSDDTAPWD